MMKGQKRFAVSDSNLDTNDSAFRVKRAMAGPPFDVQRAEPSQQATPPLDMQRAQSSRQHVRALNTQFASWVQTQLKNHPDELWEDGVQDYLAHTSNIMEKFSDVVNWIKANAARGESLSAVGSVATEKKQVPESKISETKLFQGKPGFSPSSINPSFPASWSSGGFSNSQSGKSSNGQSEVSSNRKSVGFSNSQSGVSNSQAGVFSNNPSGLFSNNPSGVFSNSQSGVFSSNQSSVFSNSQSSLFSNSQSSLFSNSQTPVLFGTQSFAPKNHDASDDVDGEDEPEQPSSPSLKKSEEKGTVVVHEVKCKLYVKSIDPADKDTWKDKGTGQLSVKCKEGVSKGTKESKPTIVIRNDVGKVVLNALIYPGIKTNLQKNSLVAIFHTSGDDADNESVVARTFLIRTKTEDDRNKLAAAIQEHAPAS